MLDTGSHFLASTLIGDEETEDSLFPPASGKEAVVLGRGPRRDMGFSAEFLKEAGLYLDRRNEFPRKATSVSVAPERQVPAFALGPMRRGLAESVERLEVQRPPRLTLSLLF